MPQVIPAADQEAPAAQAAGKAIVAADVLHHAMGYLDHGPHPAALRRPGRGIGGMPPVGAWKCPFRYLAHGVFSLPARFSRTVHVLVYSFLAVFARLRQKKKSYDFLSVSRGRKGFQQVSAGKPSRPLDKPDAFRYGRGTDKHPLPKGAAHEDPCRKNPADPAAQRRRRLRARDSGAWPPSKNSKKAFINRQGYGIIETASKAVEYRPDPV